MKYGSLQWLVPAGLLSLPVPAPAWAQSQASGPDNAFTLGQITVTAPRIQEGTLADQQVDSQELWSFNVKSLDEAVKLVPGVMATLDGNGRRNEHDIFVRGFGRWQVPLSVDGIRVYLPADNRLDFTRFLTQDLAQVQIQKGYASVLDGPGAMGGAINLVTRKPVEEFESEFQAGAFFGGEGYEGWNAAAILGTRQERWYAQVSGSYLDRDHWGLPDDFSPTSMENGGKRDGSDNRDWRVNVKLGYTPNETDEYSLSYVSQSGEKGAPLNVYNNPPVPPNSYWRWPWWDVENLYWLSSTQIGDSAYVKTRLFYNTFDNALYAYDDASYTTQSANGRFRSIYDDSGYGGSIETAFGLTTRNTLKAAVHYRNDEHRERNLNRPTHPTLATTEPWQKAEENTWSLALENTFRASAALDVIVGASYDRSDLGLVQEFDTTQGLFERPTQDNSAVNGQAAMYWRQTQASEWHVSVSSRTRFPTLFERFSSRFGTAVPNPGLAEERSTNYEIGWRGRLQDDSSFSAAVFFNDVGDAIETVFVSSTPALTQFRNVGNGEYYGLELAVDARLNDRLRAGANYTYLHKSLDLSDPLQTFRQTGTPENQAFAFVSYQLLPSLTLTPSVEFADDRWSEVNTTGYVRTGDYVLGNLQLQYRHEAFELAVGGRNLLDEDYQLAWGLPEPGRTWFAKVRFSY